MSFKAELTIEVRGRAKRLFRAPMVKELDHCFARALRAAGVEERLVALSLVDDDEILALNRQYADEDHATDVLSFAQDAPLLGDVIISIETAARQAQARAIELGDEVLYLAIHGLAHLQGLDHATRADERAMFDYADRLLAEAYRTGRPRRVSLPGVSSRRPRRA